MRAAPDLTVVRGSPRRPIGRLVRTIRGMPASRAMTTRRTRLRRLSRHHHHRPSFQLTGRGSEWKAPHSTPPRSSDTAAQPQTPASTEIPRPTNRVTTHTRPTHVLELVRQLLIDHIERTRRTPRRRTIELLGVCATADGTRTSSFCACLHTSYLNRPPSRVTAAAVTL